MTLRSTTIDPLADERWQTFVATSPNATIFHHVEWLRLLHAQYGYRMLAHCVVDSDERIVAGLPLAHVRSRLTGNRLVALPFSDLCPFAFDATASDHARQLLLASLREEHERLGIDIEVRAAAPGLPVSGKGFYHHEIPLGQDLDAVRSRFVSNVRRGITRATREGIEVRRGTGVEELDAFYRLHLRTRQRQGVPTQPRRFIRRFARLFDAGLGFVLLAVSDDQPVAAALYLNWGDTLTYKYGASAPEHLNKRPNHAIFMESIRWGCEHGATALDLGRTDLDNEGLRSFKRGWGGDERELVYTALSRRPKTADSGVPSLARTLITRTPAMTGRLAGLALYRHFG
jgi:CelD/BcsL family acetyltransferase involved in cellulose biosynthesis